MNKVSILVGNGFNYFILNYLENPMNKESIKDKLKNTGLTKRELEIEIERLTENIKKYCELLDFLYIKDTPTNGEELLKNINTFFENLEANNDCNKEIIDILERGILSKIERIFNETAIKKEDGKLQFVNATIKNLFKENKKWFSTELEKIICSVTDTPYYVFTTNYDYIVHSVFAEKYDTIKINNFVNKRGVGGVKNIHGHFKETENHGRILCCSPTQKKDKVELEGFNLFCKNIKESSIILLFGIGLTTDPHILNLINNQMNKKIIIIDANQSQYYQNNLINTKGTELEFKFLLNNEIYFIETNTYRLMENNRVSITDTPVKLLSELERTFKML